MLEDPVLLAELFCLWELVELLNAGANESAALEMLDTFPDLPSEGA